MRKISEVFVNGICLEDILEKHKKWLNGEEDGEKADLSGTNLFCVDLSGANLSGANLRATDLRFADLSDADLSDVDLSRTNLRGVDLSYADLSYADLRDSYLRDSNLNYVNLSYANLGCADLRDADLNKVSYNHQTSFFALVCPEEGSFIGYKKAGGKIVKLLITEDAKRSSATTRKCRCSKAKVLNITNIENTEEYNEVASDYDNNFIYRVGETVEVKDFDDDRWHECSTGIHFFITRYEAIRHL
jgi:hypothetical protein